ncbi:quinolinate synthase NadA [Chitinispirillales bacterium ANBcel5]|uniref:quinolinate synthase NadA n=1 Tax=Cellulosispirillum alkaliphilum TaxID=3039283 RepID=UPI002A54AB4E|nr:quinolinate synthase NadA [Chitinispirillales bacterium ANBcel5]
MDIKEQIKRLKKEKNAVILAHTYQPGDIQDAADYVGDSYGLSVQASNTDADVIVFCGVRFMAETAHILSPSKKVILPAEDAGCPMADMINGDDIVKLKEKYPDYLVMCYVNSTSEIKAHSDVCCTSSNAVKIAQKLPPEKGILFVPDQHLGSYIMEQLGREMVLWDGFCPTHVRIQPEMIKQARELYPDASILIHPEAPRACRELCDQVLSTGQMVQHVKTSETMEFVIATELGLIHTLQRERPDKTYHPLFSGLLCPNMKKGSLEQIVSALEGTGGEVITLPQEIRQKAKYSLTCMLELS